MPDWPRLSLFISVTLLLVFMPGPNTLYIIVRSIQQGRKAGIVSSLGVQVGSLVHIAAAALGVSALLLSSALAFNVVKYAGAAYLIYLGVKTLLTKEKVGPTQAVQKASLSRAFCQGVVVNLLNPKTALFFFAFLPQFIDPARGRVAVQIILLGSILVLLGTLSDFVYALAAGGGGHWPRGDFKFFLAPRRFARHLFL